MAGWSFSIGRVFGVEVRFHSFFLFLLVGCMMWASYLNRPISRGVMLWLLVVVAVALRELGRALAAAWFGLDLRRLLLLPTGGLPTYANTESTGRASSARVQQGMALAGPLASLAAGLTLAGIVLTVAPTLSLVAMPWVSPLHLVRAVVWVNLLLAAINLLPAWPLDGGRVMKTAMQQGAMRPEGKGLQSAAGRRALTRLGPAIAVGMIVLGMLVGNWWVIAMGIAILLGAQVEREGLALEIGAESVKVSEVMLTEYSVLSASATLEDALEHARHTLQDIFPVVRGGNMVGAVARQTVLDALAATGNGYVQGVMARGFFPARPQDSLVTVLGRVSGKAGASAQMIPVVDGDRIVGIVTPQNLGRSVGLIARNLAPGSRN